ncbi:hypothetical protein C8Q76DRAFT_571570, partial [Earliella scabrosa]
MIDNDEYQQDMFRWLESLIKCELLGSDDNVVQESPGCPLPRPRYSERDGYIHPGMRPGPMLNDYPPTQFQVMYEEYVNELVTQYNWHEHTDTCWKYLRKSQSKTDENCRMRMNGVTRPYTCIDEETGSILLRRLHPRIACYNDLIIFLMKANMDIKHVGSGEGAKALIYYVTDYITKTSLPTELGLAALMYAISRTNEKYKDVQEWGQRQDTGALTIVINSMLCRQEISHPQIMSYIIGGGDRYTSHRYRILYLGAFARNVLKYWDSRHRELETGSSDLPGDLDEHSRSLTEGVGTTGQVMEEIETSGDDEDITDDSVMLTFGAGSISAVNQQQDYAYRPREAVFESMCLYEFVGMTEKMTRRAEDGRVEARLSVTT